MYDVSVYQVIRGLHIVLGPERLRELISEAREWSTQPDREDAIDACHQALNLALLDYDDELDELAGGPKASWGTEAPDAPPVSALRSLIGDRPAKPIGPDVEGADAIRRLV